MSKNEDRPSQGEILEEDIELSLPELCRICRLDAEQVHRMVAEGILEPAGRQPQRWRFGGASIVRIRCVLRLERDLGVNYAGAALVLDLLDEIELLRAQLQRIEPGANRRRRRDPDHG